MLERDVRVPVDVIVQNSVPLAERATGAVLSAQSHAGPLHDECRERQRFARGPVEWALPTGHLPALLDEAL